MRLDRFSWGQNLVLETGGGVFMAHDYAGRLRPYENKGRLGLAPDWDRLLDVQRKVQVLAQWLRAACGDVVVHTGAGVSTAAGVRDFRGPHGVWSEATRSKNGRSRPGVAPGAAQQHEPLTRDGARCADVIDPRTQPPPPDCSLELAAPTWSHWALTELVRRGLVRRIVTQNIDGLHLRSGLARHRLSELHGNIFAEQCERCGQIFLNDVVVPTVGGRRTGHQCVYCAWRGQRASTRDMLLDWEDPLPQADLMGATEDSRNARLCLVMGSSLQMVPAATLPALCLRKDGARLVIVNASWTARDDAAHLVIRAPTDMVMLLLLDELALLPPGDARVRLWRPQLTLGVRWRQRPRQSRPSVDVCVWNGNGNAPGLTLDHTLHGACKREPSKHDSSCADTPLYWIPLHGRMIADANQVPALEALELDASGHLSLTVAGFGQRSCAEPPFCTAAAVSIRLGFPQAPRGTSQPPLVVPNVWYFLSIPRAGWLEFNVVAYRAYVVRLLASEWVQSERIQLPPALLFYREDDRRRCSCIVCGASVPPQKRTHHVQCVHAEALGQRAASAPDLERQRNDLQGRRSEKRARLPRV